jgi:hypothetical protein
VGITGNYEGLPGVDLSLHIQWIDKCQDFVSLWKSECQIPKESISEIIYILLGTYKIFWFVLNLVPYVVLVILAKNE